MKVIIIHKQLCKGSELLFFPD